MKFLKSFLRGIFALGFKFLIFLLALVGTIILTFGSPSTLKKTLADSGIYNKVTSVALSAASDSLKDEGNNQPQPGMPGQPGNQDQNKKDEGINIDFNDPEIKQIANDAFPPQFLQASTENVVDGVFHWLNGAVPQPDFRVDLTIPKKTLSEGLGNYAQKRAASLPACTDGRTEVGDPFSDTCLPVGTDTAKIKQSVIDNLNGVKKEGETNQNGENKDNAFLKNPVVTADSLKQEGNDKSPFEKLSVAPKAYKAAKYSPLLIGILAFFSAAFMILLYDDKRRGFRNVAIMLISAGLLLVIFTFLINMLFNKANQTEGLSDLQNETRELILIGTKAVNKVIDQGFYIYGGAYIALGTLTLLTLRLTRPKEDKDNILHHKHDEKSGDMLDKIKQGEDLEAPDKPAEKEASKPDIKKPEAKKTKKVI